MQRISRQLCFLVVSVAAVTIGMAAHAETRLHQYQITIDRELTTLSARACFDGEPPSRLVAAERDASGYLNQVEAVSADRARSLSASRRRINTTSLTRDECVEYKVDLQEIESREGQSAVSRFGDHLITRAGQWLWRPGRLAADEDIELRFILPDGLSVSAPWQPLGDRENHYRIGHTPPAWPARVAFGPFQKTLLPIGASELRIAVLDDGRQVDADNVSLWLQEAALAVADLYGRFPIDSAQVLVIAAADGESPVPWGQISRGGSPSALFIVNPDIELSEYRRDWTAAHELSHLLLPYVSRREAWLSEGFASYYQNIARSRAGMLSSQQVWQNLHDGFGRGLAGTKRETLAQATRLMRDGNNYMRVYWSGVAMALMADIELRELSDGQQTLADALRQLGDCCLPSSRSWSGREVFERLDGITETRVFTTLYAAHVNARIFPDLSDAWERLGIEVDDGVVVLSGNAEHVALRDAIAAPARQSRVAAE